MTFSVLTWIFVLAVALHNLEEALLLPAWVQKAGRWSYPVGAKEFRFTVVVLTAAAAATALAANIVGMIVQQALALGLTGFAFGVLLVANIKDYFPRRVVLEPDNVLALGGVVVFVCLIASALGVRAALRADPATALGS